MHKSTAAELAAHLAAEEAKMAAEEAAIDAAWELDQRRIAEEGPTDPEVLRIRLKVVRGEQLTFEEQRIYEDDLIDSIDRSANRPAEEREIDRLADGALAAIRRRQRYQQN